VTRTRSPVGSLYLAYRKITTPLASATTAAGMSAARNRSRIEIWAIVPSTIMVIEGGIRMPVPEAAPTIAAAHGLR